MLRRYLSATLLLAVFVALTASTVKAQSPRPERTVYITPKVGVVGYRGDDFDETIHDFNGQGIPFGVGVDLGYQFTPSFGLQLGYLFGKYKDIDEQPVNFTEDEDRHTASALLRWTIGGGRLPVAPFLEVGGAANFGGNDQAFGPMAGLGLDFVVSDRISILLEATHHLAFPDDAADFSEVGDQSFDQLSFLGLGLKYSFRSAFTPIAVSAVDCPTQLQAGQAGTFTATANTEEATEPYELRWDFGDQANATGLVASHSFSQPGTYTVTFTGSNRGTTSTQTCSVRVVPPPVPAEVVSITPSQTTFEVCDQPVTVNFSANVRGDQPVTYTWNFGDGATGTGATASHAYSRPGTYTVTLTVSNASGSNSQSVTINAQNCTAACRDISELNSVYFDRNSSTLTDEARGALQDNIEILRECPTICVRIEGWAAPGERNVQGLSEDRARSVEQFYIDNGVSGSRIMAVGMGQVQGMTSKKEGAERARRADSLPMACDAMGSK